MKTVVQGGLSSTFHFKALYPHKSPAIGKHKAWIGKTIAAIVARKAPISTTIAAITTTKAAILKRTAREKKEVEKLRR